MNILSFTAVFWFIAINIISAAATIYDKRAAIRRRRRIKENTLLFISLIGGSAAMFITMLLIRHKTRRIKFMLLIPLIFVLQCAAVYLIWRLV